eukprot:Opistho-2@7374
MCCGTTSCPLFGNALNSVRALCRRLLCFPQGNNPKNNSLSLYIDLSEGGLTQQGWVRFAFFRLTAISHAGPEYNVSKRGCNVCFVLFVCPFCLLCVHVWRAHASSYSVNLPR